MEVQAQVIESMGSEKYVYFEIGREQEIHLESVAEMTDDTGGEEEDTEGASGADSSGELMVARVSPESTAKENQSMKLIIDPEQDPALRSRRPSKQYCKSIRASVRNSLGRSEVDFGASLCWKYRKS